MSTGTVSKPFSLWPGALTAVVVLNMTDGLPSVSDNGSVAYRALRSVNGNHGSKAEEYRVKQLHFDESLYKARIDSIEFAGESL